MHVLLSISGKDRAGIVRDVAESLLNIQANIEDSSMTALRGRFTMMLIVHIQVDDISELKASLAALEQRTDLTVQSQVLPEDEASQLCQEPDCVITVSGADQAGIVHAVTDVLANMAVSIVDVSTQIRSNDTGDMYMMALEVVSHGKSEALAQRLQNTARQLAVEIQLHDLSSDIL
ncbi:MAG: ACT domain-containing protein [Mariprofundaceae bacterium]|nr:ACT domain-containing protein [Mariprofundaceae bacterium]